MCDGQIYQESNNRKKGNTKQLEVREINCITVITIIIIITIIITIGTTTIVLFDINDNTYVLFSSYRMEFLAIFWKSPFPHMMGVILAGCPS